MNQTELLITLVNQNSFTQNKKGVDVVGNIVRKELSFMNIRRYAHKTFGDLLVFSSKKNDPKRPMILLSGHSDTVHSPSSDIKTIRKGNTLYGAGTDDMKGGLVVIIEILKSLNTLGKLSNVTFTLTPDEEMSSNAHKNTLAKIYKKQDFALVYEGSKTFYNNKYSTKKRSVVIGRKGFGGAEFEIKAPGGHSGVIREKSRRISAIQEAANKVIQIEALANYAKGTTTNPGVISGGTVLNAIAQNCKIVADYRVMTGEERIRIRKDYENLAKKNFIKGTSTKLNWLYDIPPMQTTKEIKRFGDLAVKIGRSLGMKIELEQRGGGSDANQIAQFGAAVIDGLGPQGGRDHSIEEFLFIDSIKPSVDLSLKIIGELSK